DVAQDFRVPEPEEKSSEVGPRAARLGPPPDDARLRALDLQFSPVGATSPGQIRGVEMLGYQALAAMLHRRPVESPAASGHELAQAKARGAGVAEDTHQAGSSRGEGKRTQVLRPVAEDVEGDEADRLVGLGALACPGERTMDASLEVLEPGRHVGLVQ